MIAMPQMQQFGAGIGPPAAPQPDEESFQYAIMQRARQDAMKMQLRATPRAQVQGSIETAAGAGGRVLGTTLGRLSATALAPASQAAVSGLPPIAAGAATSSIPASGVAPAATSTLSQVAGGAASALGIAALGYGAYQGNIDATKSIDALEDAVSSGQLSKHEEEAARQKLFNAAMVKFGVGSGAGVLAGSEFGVPGMIVGGAIGGFGGAKQAYGAYDNPWDAVKAYTRFKANPFKR